MFIVLSGMVLSEVSDLEIFMLWFLSWRDGSENRRAELNGSTILIKS